MTNEIPNDLFKKTQSLSFGGGGATGSSDFVHNPLVSKRIRQ